jgi:lysyl-tRNA synthetase class II
MASLEELRAERLKKLEALKAEGINPYPIEASPDYSIAKTIAKFEALVKAGKGVTLVGRVRALRGQGALIFFKIFSYSFFDERIFTAVCT